jgi:hypothetical protein
MRVRSVHGRGHGSVYRGRSVLKKATAQSNGGEATVQSNRGRSVLIKATTQCNRGRSVQRKVTAASSFNPQVVTANTIPQYNVDNACLIPKQGAGCNDQKTENWRAKLSQ